MIDFLVNNLWLVWTLVSIVCLILELSSGDLYITCLAIGAVGSIVAALLGLPFWSQAIVWAVCSVLSIWLLRPKLMARLHNGDDERLSNADALIGRTGTVIDAIEPEKPGYVKVDGDEWRAVTNNGSKIPVDEKVRIISRESIVVTVEQIN